MQDPKHALLWTVYLVLAFVLVSMSGTYKITGSIFGKIIPGPWPVGMDIKQPGFLLHVLVFALLVAVPLFLCKMKA